MSLISTLEFARDTRPPYFDPGSDLTVYNMDNEEWVPLYRTTHSLTGLISALKRGGISESHVRFRESIAKEYLEALQETDFETDLHYEELMNRDRVVALVNAGYTQTDDLIGMNDQFDIEGETGIDRDIISSISRKYLDGFSAGTSFRDEGKLDELEPRDDFTGWQLTVNSGNQIRWVSRGRFNLTMTPSADGSTILACNAPGPDRHSWYRKGRTLEVDPDLELSPDKAIKRAHDWLERHPIEFEDDLTNLPHIGPATGDYLVLEYGIKSKSELIKFYQSQPKEFTTIFGSSGEELGDALKNGISE